MYVHHKILAIATANVANEARSVLQWQVLAVFRHRVLGQILRRLGFGMMRIEIAIDWARLLRNPIHTILIYVGLVAGGIENLNEDEMSDLFDQYCFCKQDHSSEALVKMRNRLMHTLKREG